MDPHHLIEMARFLASGAVTGGIGRPRRADLRRALSDAYYAMFHALAWAIANSLAGATPARRDPEAWRRAYRALEHGYARNQFRNQSEMDRFPPEIRGFGQAFVMMQARRHLADYDPYDNPKRREVIQFITEAEGAIALLEGAPPAVRRSLALYVLLRNR